MSQPLNINATMVDQTIDQTMDQSVDNEIQIDSSTPAPDAPPAKGSGWGLPNQWSDLDFDNRMLSHERLQLPDDQK